MAVPVIAALAAAGLAKGLLDRRREQADRRQAAEMARWSPWTGMQPNQIQRADILGSTMQGGLTGAMLGGGDLSFGGGGEAAPAAADPAAQASLTGGQSQMAPTGSQMALEQKYPWLGMSRR